MGYSNPAEQREYQRLWVARRRREYIAKHGGKCSNPNCESEDNLEFHHRNRDEKIDHKIWSWSRKRIEEELKKCELLCAKCHLKETGKERGYWQYIHGTLASYQEAKCRCELCRAANAKSQG